MTIQDFEGKEGLTEAFKIETGVRQGCSSATLFNIVIEAIIRRSFNGSTLARKAVQELAYADDLVVITRSKKSTRASSR